MRHEDWTFESLLLDDQDVIVKLLATVPLDAQAVISEFVRARVSYKSICYDANVLFFVFTGLKVRRSTFLPGK